MACMQIAGAAATGIAEVDMPILHARAAALAARLCAPPPGVEPTGTEHAAALLPLPPTAADLTPSQPRSSFQTPLTSPVHPSARAPPPPAAPAIQLKLHFQVRKTVIAILDEKEPDVTSGGSPPATGPMHEDDAYGPGALVAAVRSGESLPHASSVGGESHAPAGAHLPSLMFARSCRASVCPLHTSVRQGSARMVLLRMFLILVEIVLTFRFFSLTLNSLPWCRMRH